MLREQNCIVKLFVHKNWISLKQDFKERPFLIEEFLKDNLFWCKWIEDTDQVDCEGFQGNSASAN